MELDTDYRYESARRYYTARLSIDLLGDYVVQIASGGLYNRLGKTWTVSVPSLADGLAMLVEIGRVRELRRYVLVAASPV